jgi:glycerophosphoryl diester phosphodiesterase
MGEVMEQDLSPKRRTKTTRWARLIGRILLAPVLVLVLLFIVSYGLYFLFRGPLPPDPQKIAHRGGPAHAPENTLLAFEKSIAAGVDWLEFDVQMSRDGFLVVLHDQRVDRTTNGAGLVAELTLEYLRTLDAGGGERVPTFEEVIDLAKRGGVGILPEVKAPQLYPGIEGAVVAALIEAGYLDRAIIQSFVPQTLDAVRALSPAAEVCPLYGLWVLRLPEAPPGDAGVLCLMAEMIAFNPWMVRQAHRRGWRVYAWFGVIEHAAFMKLLLALGVDGIMADDPALLASLPGY